MELKIVKGSIFVSFFKTFNRTAYGIEDQWLVAPFVKRDAFNRTAYGIEDFRRKSIP